MTGLPLVDGEGIPIRVSNGTQKTDRRFDRSKLKRDAMPCEMSDGFVHARNLKSGRRPALSRSFPHRGEGQCTSADVVLDPPLAGFDLICHRGSQAEDAFVKGPRLFDVLRGVADEGNFADLEHGHQPNRVAAVWQPV